MPGFESGNETRRKFIDYFASKDHRVVRSSDLVPSADPTLLFTNAGMVPFKDTFLGKEKRDYARAVSSQKCLRVSGKHNDLEEVGRTNRHNTFFEMLGNFSFGDYFKEKAIEYAWEFLTETVKLPKEKLWITVYEKDDEADKLWQKVAGLPPERIKALNEKDNFWSMGATGPCGPCSEIYIDNGEKRGCGKPECAPGCDCDRYEELWNLVFMQYNRTKSGHLEPLPKPNIDTGMGLERLASVLQGVESNFDTDLIRPIIGRAEDVLEKTYGVNRDDDVSLRVIGDHIRSAVFLITEGILPSNENRGYIVRRIMRRAMRHGKILGATGPFLYRVAGSVIDIFKQAYPELRKAESTMAEIIKSEERRFGKTLENGMRILGGIVEKAKAQNRKSLDGKEIFKLYDTYGFPLDLAEDVLKDAGLSFEQEDFNRELERQRDKARQSAKTATVSETTGFGDSVTAEVIRNGKVIKELPSALSGLEKTGFSGYETFSQKTSVVAIMQNGERVEEVSQGQEAEIFIAQTSFYAESGGQAGDTGEILSETGAGRVMNTKNIAGGLIVHNVKINSGVIKTGQEVTAKVDGEKRLAVMRNHTATHLLQSALRQVLGDHVKQSGSLVEIGRLRFDFSHYEPLASSDLRELEDIVNRKIRENVPVTTEVMGIEAATDSGAMALFGEKYADKVRVVSVGGFSKELCGGTHVSRTGEVALFKITAETGVAAGIRRIEALTGESALGYFYRLEDKTQKLAGMLKTRPEDIAMKTQKILTQNRELEKTLKKMKSDLAHGSDGGGAQERMINGVKVVAKRIDDVDSAQLRSFVDDMKVKIKSGVVMAGGAQDGKVILIAGVTKDLSKKLNAGKIVKSAAKLVGGNGGGRPDMAQAGGLDVGKTDEALNSVFTTVEKSLPL